MPLTGDAKRVYNRERYEQAARERATIRARDLAVQTEAPRPVVAPVKSKPVLKTADRRQALRVLLDDAKERYTVHQQAMEWPACSAVNRERDPWFRELWQLERELPVGERYWCPNHVMNEGMGFGAKA